VLISGCGHPRIEEAVTSPPWARAMVKETTMMYGYGIGMAAGDTP